MRKRTKMNGLVSHTNQDGTGCLSQKERAYNALRKLENLVNNGYKVSDAKVKKLHTSEPKVVVRLFGELVEITVAEATRCNLKIEIL